MRIGCGFAAAQKAPGSERERGAPEDGGCAAFRGAFCAGVTPSDQEALAGLVRADGAARVAAPPHDPSRPAPLAFLRVAAYDWDAFLAIEAPLLRLARGAPPFASAAAAARRRALGAALLAFARRGAVTERAWAEHAREMARWLRAATEGAGDRALLDERDAAVLAAAPLWELAASLSCPSAAESADEFELPDDEEEDRVAEAAIARVTDASRGARATAVRLALREACDGDAACEEIAASALTKFDLVPLPEVEIG